MAVDPNGPIATCCICDRQSNPDGNIYPGWYAVPLGHFIKGVWYRQDLLFCPEHAKMGEEMDRDL